MKQLRWSNTWSLLALHCTAYPSSWSFITDAFKERESDLVYSVPFRQQVGDEWLEILIYILIEHQSEPISVMIDRLWEYMLEIRKFDRRRSRVSQRSATPAPEPIIVPLVFYTGTKRWDELRPKKDNVPKLLRRFSYTPDPIFVNLREIPDRKIRAKAGFLAPVLQLIRHRKAKRSEFERLLRDATAKYEDLYEEDPTRSREFFWYIEGLVRHCRRMSEISPMQEIVVDTLHDASLHQEVDQMFKSAADVMVEGTTKRILLTQLNERFGDKITDDIVAAVEQTDDLDVLEDWLKRAA